jgi:uncharacterized short protein YbdD (DUF466 family)
MPRAAASNVSTTTKAARLLRRLWRGLREWSGDDAYDRYLRSARAQSGSSASHAPLTATEFYVDQLNRRYSRPNRCC